MGIVRDISRREREQKGKRGRWASGVVYMASLRREASLTSVVRC
jgi:hypothetical protein